MSVNLAPSGANTLGLRVSAVTVAGARCGVAVSSAREHLGLPSAIATRGRISWQWLVRAGAPSGAWRFSALCQHGAAGGRGQATALILVARAKSKTSMVAPDSLQLLSGRRVKSPRRQVRKIPRLGKGAGPTNPGYPGYCTWGAWNIARWLGTAVNGRNGRNGDARNWYDNAREAGLPTGMVPIAGAVFVHKVGTYGHVGIVTGGITANSFSTREMNGGSRWVNVKQGITNEFGKYENHTQYYGPGTNMYFIYPPGTRPTQPPPTPPQPNLSQYSGHIVQWDGDRNTQKTAWLVGGDLKRRWIPDATTYNCLKAQGTPGPDVLPASILDLLPDQDGTGGKPLEHATCSQPTTPTPPSPPQPSPPPPPATRAETTGGATNTWTNFTNAGGTQGPTIPAFTTVQIACKVTGFKVADGNTWWYRIASAPWSGQFYASADAFYNNGATSGSLSGTPFVDSAVANC